MVITKITAKNLWNTQSVMIDVRSESEYLDGHVPPALNIPLLNDAERIEIGTLYKQKGPDPARLRGLELVAPKVSRFYLQLCKAAGVAHQDLVRPSEAQRAAVFKTISKEIMGLSFEFENEEVEEKGTFEAADVKASEINQPHSDDLATIIQPPHKSLIFYCWRGGARSRSMAQFASLFGFDCSVIEGGHKAFRNEVLGYLGNPGYGFTLCVLYGLTGSGKTNIIRKWMGENKPVIDLEALAHHRGSAFGQVGIPEMGRQKDFENNLYWQMQLLKERGEKMVVVEGESQRIGRCKLPDAFMRAMNDGYHVKVQVAPKERVENILREYVNSVEEDELLKESRGALGVIKKRLGDEKFRELSKILDEKNYTAFTEQLLVHYYDKTYDKARAPDDFYQLEISSAEGWPQVLALVEKLRRFN